MALVHFMPNLPYQVRYVDKYPVSSYIIPYLDADTEETTCRLFAVSVYVRPSRM